jgi:hypothetical protein
MLDIKSRNDNQTLAKQCAPLRRIPRGPPAAQVYANWQRQGMQNRTKISPLERDGLNFMLEAYRDMLSKNVFH